MNLTTIKNPELKKLLEASRKFKALPKKTQQKHLRAIAKSSPEKQQKLVEYFSTENAKEVSQLKEKVALLNELYDKVVQLEKKFNSSLHKEKEHQERNTESQEMEGLLSDLDNS